MAITTYDQAIAFANSPQGQAMPGLWSIVDDLKYYKTTKTIREKSRQIFLNPLIKQVDNAQQNPVEFVKNNLSREIGNYLRSYRTVQLDPHPQQKARLETWKSSLNNSVNFLVQNNVPATEIQTIFTTAEGNYKDAVLRDIQMQSQKNFFDRILDVTDALIVGGLTGGLGLSPVNAAALSSALAIANGADVETALKAGLAGLGAGQVGQYLQTVNAISGNEIVNSAVTNASRQATAATIMGQDVKTAAMAGLAGGLIGGGLLRATDNAAISRAAGEYTQAMAAGMSPAAAMVQALSGFAEEEMVDAKTKIEQEAEMQRTVAKAPPATVEDQIVEAFSQPKSPGVGTQIGEPTAELAGGIQYGSRQGAAGTDIVSDVDLPSVSVKPVAVDKDTLPTVVVTAKPEDIEEPPPPAKRYDVRTGKLITTRIPTPTKTQKEPTSTLPAEELTGVELIESAATPDTEVSAGVTETGVPKASTPKAEGGAGEAGEEAIAGDQVGAGEGEGVGEGEGEGEGGTAAEEVTDEDILAAIEASRDPLLLSLLGGGRGRTPPPPSSISARAVGTSPTAAIVGDKEPLFGGEEDTQQDVWNTRSLRLRKALG